MKAVIERIDQAMPPGSEMDVTLESFQNVAQAIVLARSFIQTQDFQIRALQAQLDFRSRYLVRDRECND